MYTYHLAANSVKQMPQRNLNRGRVKTNNFEAALPIQERPGIYMSTLYVIMISHVL